MTYVHVYSFTYGVVIAIPSDIASRLMAAGFIGISCGCNLMQNKFSRCFLQIPGAFIARR